MAFETILAEAIIYAWPVIPIFWLTTHLLAIYSKRSSGPLPYLFTLMAYSPLGLLLHKEMSALIGNAYPLPMPFRVFGWTLFIAACLVHIWTIYLLGIRIVGLPEVAKGWRTDIVTSGPFKYSRHPTYLAHHLMFVGAWLATGFYSLLVVAVLDILMTQLVIIPLEESELKRRFGPKYEEYKRRTPRILGPTRS